MIYWNFDEKLVGGLLNHSTMYNSMLGNCLKEFREKDEWGYNIIYHYSQGIKEGEEYIDLRP